MNDDIYDRTSEALLQLLIQDNCTMKAKLEKEIDTYSGSLHTSADKAQVLKIMDWYSI